MAAQVFQLTPILLDRDDVPPFKEGHTFFEPRVAVRLMRPGGGDPVETEGVIDNGAALSVFHIDILREIGVDPQGIQDTAAVGDPGRGGLSGILYEPRIQIENFPVFQTRILFSDEIQPGLEIIGVHRMLDKFTFAIDYVLNQLVLNFVDD